MPKTLNKCKECGFEFHKTRHKKCPKCKVWIAEENLKDHDKKACKGFQKLFKGIK